ncbi:hypothetical protein [Sciscionella sediminilitoris]|uniref:hypothetical protein n=1 Tax=Sciscionella sediminilitoris TaxID=1445613 RepID=UPI0012E27466|nr:hypothetical protein [Sciscionella sp. SE31]
MVRARAVQALVLAGVLGAGTGCGGAPPDSVPRDRIGAYFAELNASAARGPQAQDTFFRRTQVAQFADRYCANPGLTVTEEPTESAARPDPGWSPERGKPVSGTVYAVPVLFTAKRSGSVLASQISYARVVDEGERISGFGPCKTL